MITEFFRKFILQRITMSLRNWGEGVWQPIFLTQFLTNGLMRVALKGKRKEGQESCDYSTSRAPSRVKGTAS